MKLEADLELKKKTGSDSLKELESIKTMDWHRKPLQTVFNEFNYKNIYSEIDSSYYNSLGVSNFNSGFAK